MNSLSEKIPNLEMKIHKGDNYELKSIEGTIKLNVWIGYQSRRGAYNSSDNEEQSDGTVNLNIGGDNPEITIEHVNAYNYLTQHQDTIKDTILASLLVKYKDIQEQYGYDAEDAASIMPDVDHVSQFKSLIGLSTVHLLNVNKDETAYVGYQFGCTWDDEHGLGIMTHKDKIIQIGGADTSFLTWIAESDLNPDN
jgi:hypothetical protein